MTTQMTSRKTIELPKPKFQGALSLDEALARRRSVRDFTSKPVVDEHLSQILWAAQGVTDPEGYRTAPSAGALYPLETYVVLPEGLYHYEPRGHRLKRIVEGDLRPGLFEAALEQEAVRDAHAVVVIAAVYQRTARKYGETRGRRYVYMEVGHAAQNILLEAAALGLGAVPIGAFHDRNVHETLSLPEQEEPLYLIPVGHPR
jgi:SagB-type dehydrogenase family enzyme